MIDLFQPVGVTAAIFLVLAIIFGAVATESRSLRPKGQARLRALAWAALGLAAALAIASTWLWFLS